MNTWIWALMFVSGLSIGIIVGLWVSQRRDQQHLGQLNQTLTGQFLRAFGRGPGTQRRAPARLAGEHAQAAAGDAGARAQADRRDREGTAYPLRAADAAVAGRGNLTGAAAPRNPDPVAGTGPPAGARLLRRSHAAADHRTGRHDCARRLRGTGAAGQRSAPGRGGAPAGEPGAPDRRQGAPAEVLRRLPRTRSRTPEGADAGICGVGARHGRGPVAQGILGRLRERELAGLRGDVRARRPVPQRRAGAGSGIDGLRPAEEGACWPRRAA